MRKNSKKVWQLTKVRNKTKEVIDEARKEGKTVHFASLMDICHLKIPEQGSSASQMTAAKVMDVIARPPRCAVQAADAVSAYTQVKMEDAPSFSSQKKVRKSRYLDTSTKTHVATIMVQHERPSRSS